MAEPRLQFLLVSCHSRVLSSSDQASERGLTCRLGLLSSINERKFNLISVCALRSVHLCQNQFQRTNISERVGQNSSKSAILATLYLHSGRGSEMQKLLGGENVLWQASPDGFWLPCIHERLQFPGWNASEKGSTLHSSRIWLLGEDWWSPRIGEPHLQLLGIGGKGGLEGVPLKAHSSSWLCGRHKATADELLCSDFYSAKSALGMGREGIFFHPSQEYEL